MTLGDYIVKTVTMRGWNAAHAVAVENAVADGTIATPTHVIPPKPKVPIVYCPNCGDAVADCGCGWHCAKGLHELCKGLDCKCWHHRERLDEEMRG